MPHPIINRILRKKSVELKKYSCYSVWYYDEETKKIIIRTTRPGLWIGQYGVDVDELKKEINESIKEYKLDPISITFIECES